MDVIVGGSVQEFVRMLVNLSGGCVAVGQALAERLDVPYQAEREGERFLGHRLRTQTREEALEVGLLPTRRFRMPSGEEVDTDDFPRDGDQLTEEVWTRDNWPDSYNTCADGVAKMVHGVTAVYYHRPSMNLVLVGPGGERVGIRSTEFKQRRVEPLSRLTKCSPASA